MIIKNSAIQRIKNIAEKHFINLGPSHDWSHVERVLKTAMSLGKKEKADLNILKIAVYLHDIARKDLKEKNYDHALEGAKIARKILEKEYFPKDQIGKICHCVESHRFRNEKIPKTKEAKCLHDADKLDVLGALGIARSYIYLGETKDCVIYLKPRKKQSSSKKRTNSVQEEYEIKYKHLPGKMLTKSGKILAKERLKYMESFLKRLEKEIKGFL